jgi:hypothetical protein
MKQYFLEQGAKENRAIIRNLRKAGYKVITSSLGNQVTNFGLIKTTMVSIFNSDGNETIIINGRDYASRGV